MLVEYGSLGTWREIEDEEVSDVFSEDGADQRAKFVQINVINSVKFAQSNVTGSVKFVKISVTDSVKFVQISVMDPVKIRADQRDGFSKIPADHGDGFGFYSRRRTCKCQEETGETKRAGTNETGFSH